jgi:hypothetical protein
MNLDHGKKYQANTSKYSFHALYILFSLPFPIKWNGSELKIASYIKLSLLE